MSGPRSNSIPAIELPSNNPGRTSKNASPTRAARSFSATDNETQQSVNPNTSPTRAPNGSSSMASIPSMQRASGGTKTASNGNDSSSDAMRDRRQRSGPSAPQWPTSPRLKSPPPAVSLRSIASRKLENEQAQSSTTMRKLVPVSSAELGAAMQVSQESLREPISGQPNLRPPGRGANAQGGSLETVAEGSVPPTPSVRPIPTHDQSTKLQVAKLEHGSDGVAEPIPNKDIAKTSVAENATKSVLDKTETASSSRATSTSRPPTNLAKRSLTSLTGKTKAVVEPLRTMTIETETVSSNPPLITDRAREGGSVRTKPSTETIRPRKEKKKTSRKTTSHHAGMNSSKADIFEAKVASAVDEADSSDSDETFVYESNPPEPRHARHHSRTPSATSLASQVDHHGTRTKHGLRSNSTAVGGKKSMKFSNSMYGNQLDAEGAGDSRNSTRTTSSTPRHHHISRHSRSGHPSIMDTDSPFTSANQASSPRTPATRNSRPSSPRTSNGRLHFSRKSASASYDAYDDGADDERAPLIGSVRVNRNRHTRRPNNSQFRAMHFAEDEEPGCWPRFGGCFFLGSLITLICIGVALFVVVLNRSLVDVEVLQIQNVLASEQELMLDLKIRATNPNLFTITVNELDVNIFAESPYVGTTTEWERHPHSRRLSLHDRRQKQHETSQRESLKYWFPPFNSHDGIDEGTDPIDDPEPGSQKMLLGQILEFDSPLSFDPSPVRHNPMTSVGEIRLRQPGNKTEVGGSARWERVLQHPFTLIARGVIRYQLPLSSSTKSAKIGSRIRISPGNDSSDGDSPVKVLHFLDFSIPPED